jgi:hypothetical protein
MMCEGVDPCSHFASHEQISLHFTTASEENVPWTRWSRL